MHSGALDFSLIFGFLIWIPVTIAVVTLIGWIIQAEIEPIFGMLGIALALLIGVLGFTAPDPNLSPWLFIGSISMVVIFPMGRSLRDKRELAMMDVEMVERAYEALVQNPTDIGAKLKIARTLHKRGNTEHAIALVEDALKGMPKDLFDEEHRMLSRWKSGLAGTPSPMPCLECSAKNKPGAPFCYRCGAPILLHFARGTWVHPAVFRRLLLGWLAALVSIVGIPMAATSLPPKTSAAVVPVLLATTATLIWLALKPVSRKITI